MVETERNDETFEMIGPGHSYESVTEKIASMVLTKRVSMLWLVLVIIFAHVAGLFGLAAFVAERRTREIGIRKVFGASSGDIVRLLAWQFTKPVIVANLIAWPVAWWVMQDWLNRFDARIDLGPGPFVIAGLLAFVIAIGTIAAHALRVARTNPIHALRYE
jgi:putative ABC transport system permease protein